MSSGMRSGISSGTVGTQSTFYQNNSILQAITNEETVVNNNVPIQKPGDLRYSRKKTEEYLLNKSHPKGGSKASFFENVLGYRTQDSRAFHKAIVASIIGQSPTSTTKTEFGIKHRYNVTIQGKNQNYVSANVVVVIQKDTHRITYRIITVYPDVKE